MSLPFSGLFVSSLLISLFVSSYLSFKPSFQHSVLLSNILSLFQTFFNSLYSPSFLLKITLFMLLPSHRMNCNVLIAKPRPRICSQSPAKPALLSQYYDITTVFDSCDWTNSCDERQHLDDYSLGAEKKSTPPQKKNLRPGRKPSPLFLCMSSF